MLKLCILMNTLFFSARIFLGLWSLCLPVRMGMERFAWKTIVLNGQLDEYIRRHDAIWPELVAVLKGAGIRNYSIWNAGNGMGTNTQPGTFSRPRRAGTKRQRQTASIAARSKR
jgi:hypothetical protein